MQKGWAVVTGLVLTNNRFKSMIQVIQVYQTVDAFHDAVSHAEYVEGASVVPYVEED